jgi:hypothetical protein
LGSSGWVKKYNGVRSSAAMSANKISILLLGEPNASATH